MEIIIEFVKETTITEEYFKILLGGLFGIATIVVAVMSLASNIINGKCLNMYVNKMKRFNIFFAFIPIYYLVLYCFVIMIWDIWATNIWCIAIAVGVFLFLTTYCSYLVAQYVIDTERFQDDVLKVSIKKMKVELKKNNYANSIIVDYLKETFKNINLNDCRLFQDKLSREKMYNEYLKQINTNTLEDENAIEIIEVLIEEFGVDKAFEMCSDFRIGQLTFILVSSININTNLNIIQMCIDRMHSYFLYQTLIEGKKYEKYKEIMIFNKKALITSKLYFKETIQYLANTKFVMKDAFYLSNIIRQIFNIEKLIEIEELNLDTESKKFIEELLSSKEMYKWPYNNSERDQSIQTALLMIGGVGNE